MPKRGDPERLTDMFESIRRAISYTAEISYETFLIDSKTQDATIRALEILGEASKEISGEVKTQFPDVP